MPNSSIKEGKISSVRILAIETSATTGSVALLEAEVLIAAIDLNPRQRSAESLAPAMATLLEQVGWKSRQIELVATVAGPGSFTGLRVGMTTAKVFAYAVGARIVGVNTFDVIARRAVTERPRLWTVMDAQRNELFAACYERAGHEKRDGGSWTLREAPALVTLREWLSRLTSDDAISGPALNKIAPHVPAEVEILPEAMRHPTAEEVGRLAWRMYQAGHRDDPWKLVPRYYRQSAAEEKRPLKEKS